MGRFIVFGLLLLLLTSATQLRNDNYNLPPSPLPIKVETSFSLLELVTIDEKNELFKANVYFVFSWQDPRLAFSQSDHDDPKVYMDEGAQEQIKDIWWPEIEFLNKESINYNQRALFIYPNGHIEYYISLTGNFRTDLNFSKFPFDKQSLQIKVDSFLWNKNIFYFTISPQQPTFKDLDSLSRGDVVVKNIDLSTTLSPGISLERFGNNGEYSTFVVDIEVYRHFGFFLYQVFIPLTIVMFLASAAFFEKNSFLEKLSLNLAAFLVFLAAKFTINQDLPQINYMTAIDAAFLAAYLFIALMVSINIFVKIANQRWDHLKKMITHQAWWAIPLAFIFTLIAIAFLV